MRLPISFALLAPLGLAACGDDPATIVDITVVETLPVAFDAMEGGVTQGAVVALDDLRDEAAYSDAAGSLRCAAVDARASQVEVEALQTAAGATAVDYVVAVAPHGQTDFVELARFAGSIGPSDVVALDDAKVTLNGAGLGLVSSTLLGSAPRLDVQITATVPAAVDHMQLALKLAIKLSSDKAGCPSLTTGL